MFNEEINIIRETEEKAELIKKQAKIDAKKLLEDSGMRATTIVQEAQSKAKDSYNAWMEDGQKKSEAEYDEHMAAARQDCQEMIAKAKKNQHKAVTLITERIGKFSVNN